MTSLRDTIRSKMEWIAAREEFPLDPRPPKEETAMKLAPYVKFREEKFGGVLFETRSERVFTVSPTGAAVVREIAAGSTDIAKSLRERYEDKGGAIEREAAEFVTTLKEKGLVTG